MIKCLECGFESTRLQWTHFRYNCTGKFKNGSEYLKAYPTAKIVDPQLAKRTSLTKDNFIKKYGPNEGLIKWDQYRDKQAYSNSYEYKKEKYGWTKEQYDEFNSSRAITLEKCVARHGEKQGLKLWYDYCEKQAYTNSKDYFIKKYGQEEGIKKYIEVNKGKGSSSNAKLLAEKLSITENEAIEIILSRGAAQKYGSLLEKDFTENLEKEIGILEYTTFTKPFGKWSTDLNSFVVYDIKHKDCIIEFNGDYWHGNPKLYESTDTLRNGVYAKEIWERDEKKIKTAIDLGFRVMTVWELDYKKDKQETIKRVIEWMLNGQK